MNAAELGLESPFVAFVGAGASAIAPSHLPTWTGFNTVVLDALCQRLDQFSRDRQPTAQMLQTMLARRDQTNFLTPDFQAQLIEEEVGADYFGVWQSLPSTAFSPVHAALAVLARQGRLAGIVTTNFDTLIEAALQAHGVAFSVHHDVASFEALAAGRGHADEESGRGAAALPLVKIHGSIDHPASLVDTLRQRIAGRPPVLQTVLDGWLREHRWLFLGYSGADFTHAPNHLNLLALVGEAAGFVFVQRPGTTVEPGVARLLKAYGEGRARQVEAELVDFLPQTMAIDAASIPAPNNAPVSADEVLLAARAGVQRWVDRLGPFAVVNIVVALLQSWGDDAGALRLLRKTWKSYREPADMQGLAYHRYNFKFGVLLRDAGFLSNRIDLADDHSNLIEWKAGADLNAYEFLARSHHAAEHPATGAAMAGLLAYRGEVGKALGMIDAAITSVRASGRSLSFCDVAIDAAAVFDIVQVYGPTIDLMQEAHQHAMALGDVLRGARLSALLGRFLGYSGRIEEAAPWLDKAEAVAAQFDQPSLRRAAAEGRAVCLLEGGQLDAAISLLEPLANELRAGDAAPIFSHIGLGQADTERTDVKGISSLRMRVLLDLNRAAMLGGHLAAMEATLDDLDVLSVDPFRGYCPQYYWAYVQCLASHGTAGSQALIDDLLSRLDVLTEEQGNPWPAQAAAFLRQQLASAGPGSG